MEDLDFFRVAVKEKKGGGLEAFPDFVVGRSKDLMVRAKNFYAVWDEEAGLWSTDEYDVQRIVDDRLHSYRKENKDVVSIKTMRSFDSNRQSTFRKFMASIGDNAHQLDESLTFLTTQVKKSDYVSKRLPYDLSPGDISAWDEIVGTLYEPEQRTKIEWFLGAIVSGDSKVIQKFVVLYGPPGAGKGTIINIAMSLFPGYVTTFDAKALGSSNNQFAAAAFENNPHLAIQHDGDLSKIADNTFINSIVSHEILKINQKFKPAYDARINAALMMGTNKPVMITDAQSGLIRRLIDIHPSGRKVEPTRYHQLMKRIEFELGAIAYHCLQVYTKLGINYYGNYQPLEMMFKTNAFFNFIEANYDLFEKQDGVSAKQAWNLYKEYCEEAEIEKRMQNHVFRSELGNYFAEFHDRFTIDGVTVRSYYSGFKADPFKQPVDKDPKKFKLIMDQTTSLLNAELEDCPAQYSNAKGNPSKYWDDSERMIGSPGVLKRPRPDQIVSTYLRDLDPYQEHYVKTPHNHIVADFDLEDEDGNKSLERNLQAAAEWPPTYAELSRSGNAVHLHYNYDGDPTRLDPNFAPGIEVKWFGGNSALRRRLSRCNDVPVATIATGLPLKENKRVLEPGTIKSAKGLRDLIERNLRKEIHPGTKPSIDFINHILEESYRDGLKYDVSDMYQKLFIFAQRSTNKSLECLKIVQHMRLKSEEEILDAPLPEPEETRRVIYDIEVYPNLFVVCWKFEEDDPKKESIVRMINPPAHAIDALMRLKLVGFFNRNYDNHILWGAAMGLSVPELYRLSKKIVDNVPGSKFGEAYRISHVDIHDFATDKRGLKKWQIALGLEHREMDIPWDEPVPEDRIMDVVDYCVNDVFSTEIVFKHLEGDYNARCILADLSGLSINETTARHTAAIVFGKNQKNQQKNFVYTKLDQEFPGYVFEAGKSYYRDELLNEGGYVYAEPGAYRNVALLDVASMHPTSIGKLNLFGEHTPRYMAIVEAQLVVKSLVKKRNFDEARGLLDGKLTSYVDRIQAFVDAGEIDQAAKFAGDLRQGLKIAMNIVYGLTSAKFDNPFKDFRNVDNIVAKRGALFMVDLKHFVQERGYKVVHIKTDSIKIVDADPEIIAEVTLFGDKYGYTFEHEATYEKFALFNDAVYIARKDQCEVTGNSFDDDRRNKAMCWTATGTQFIPEANPYVFKKLFGYDDSIGFDDVCVTKSVQQGAMYLDFGTHEGSETLGFVDQAVSYQKHTDKEFKAAEKSGDEDRIRAAWEAKESAAKVYTDSLKKLIFIGKVGRFTPVLEGYGGGQLFRIKEGKHYAIAGTKGYLWVDSHVAMDLPDEAIDYSYFDRLVEEALADLEKLLEESDFERVGEFLS